MDTEGKDCLPEFKPIPTEDKHHSWTNGCVSRQTIDELIQFAEESNVQGQFKLFDMVTSMLVTDVGEKCIGDMFKMLLTVLRRW